MSLRNLTFDVMFKGNTSAVMSMDSATDKLKKNMTGATNSTTTANESMRKFGATASSSGSAMSGLTGKIMGVVTAIGLVAGANAVMNLSDTYSQTSSRINLMNDGLQTNAQLQDKMYAAALDTHTAYGLTADAVSKLGVTTGAAFSSSSEIVDFVGQLNKQFKIGGTSIEGQSAATLQLTQAMASGVLRGDELNSIYENAPTLISSMAAYMGVPVEKMRGLAEQGLITTGVIKNGVLGAAEKTNEQFKTMGTTFGQVWTDFKTKATMAFQPAIEKLNELSNSAGFKTFMDNAITAIGTMGPALVGFVSGIVDIFNNPAVQNFATGVIGTIGGVINSIGPFMPLIVGIVAIMASWAIITGTVGVAMAVMGGIQAISAASTAMAAGATLGQAAAQWGLNSALLACPLTWIVIAIIAMVAAVVYLWNTNEGFRTAVIGIWNAIVGAFQAAGTWILTTFNDITGACAQVGTNISNDFMGAVAAVQGAWGAVGGWFSGIVGGIGAAFSGVGAAITGAFDGAMTFMSELPGKFLQWGKDMIQGMIDGIKGAIGAVGDAVKGVADKISSFLHFSRPEEGKLHLYEQWMPDMMQGLASGITGNVGLIKNALSGLTSDMNLSINGEKSNVNMSTARNADSFATIPNSGQGIVLQTTINVTVANGADAKAVVSEIEGGFEQSMEAYVKKLGFRNPPQFA